MLAESLLKENSVNTITIVDIQKSRLAGTDNRVKSLVMDMTKPENINQVVTEETTHIFHLAAIVSSHAEQDFDLGVAVNLTTTQLLLERCRQVNPNIRFTFASSLAVFGGDLPEVITPVTALHPQSSYGTQKAIGELLVNDYARKGFVKAVSVRLPTICIRPGKPNLAASSFVSGIIREPLSAQESNCPVDPELKIWISSPSRVVENIQYAGLMPYEQLQNLSYRTLNLPGIQTTPAQMIQTMDSLMGKPLSNYITYEHDASIDRIVSSWPKKIDCSKELQLGFKADRSFEDVLQQFISVNDMEII